LKRSERVTANQLPNDPGRGVPRVLLVDNAVETSGGAKIVLDQVARGVDPSLFHLSVACLSDARRLQELQEFGLKADLVPMSRMRDVGNHLSLMKRLREIVRRDDVDLIHANENSTLLHASVLGRLTRKPVVWHVYDPFATRRLSLKLSAGSWRALPPNGLIYGTQRAADHYASWFEKVPSSVVLPGVDVDRCRSGCGARARKELGIPEHALVVSSFGRVHPTKCQRNFVECVARAQEEHPNLHGVICGSAESPGYWRSLEELRSRLGLDDSLHMPGFVPDQLKDDILAASDAVIHLAKTESFGLAVIEGMAAGKPVIAASASGPSSLIDDGVNGVLVGIGDVDGAASALRRLLGDPSERARIGERASRSADEHSLERMVNGVEQLWTEVLCRSTR